MDIVIPLIIAVIGLSLTMFLLGYNIGKAFGQDFDPCFVNNDMYKQICDKQKIDVIMDQLLERVKEWNEKYR